MTFRKLLFSVIPMLNQKKSWYPEIIRWRQATIRQEIFDVTNSNINDLIEFSGGINIAVNSKQGIYSRETVIRQNPDIIIIVTMGTNAQEQKEVWQKYDIINAVNNDKVYILNPYMVCSPTPLGFVEALREFMQIINPT